MILFKKRISKGADQTALMRRLVCACVIRKPPKTGFATSWPIYYAIIIADKAPTSAIRRVHFEFKDC